jgi:transposase, IS5 family
MSGQIADATLLAAPRQRNTSAEKAEIKAGRVPAERQSRPGKLRHKDRDARWTVKFNKAKPALDGTVPAVDLTIPVFGSQNPLGIDQGFGFIRTWKATDAAAYEGRMLREGLLDRSNTASGLGRYGLPVRSQPALHGRERLRLTRPSQEAARPSDAGQH